MNLLAELGAIIFDKIAETKDIPLTDKEYPLIRQTTEHYRRGDGTPLEIDPDELKKISLIKEATSKNQNRLLKSLLSNNTLYKKLPNGSLQKTTLNDLKDHDRIVLKDYFDSDHETNDTREQDFDIGFSLGSFKLRSNSNLEFSKSGQKLLPYGHVTHTIKDVYNFNKGSKYKIITDPMERNNKAKPYPVSSEWISSPTGVIKIKNQKLDTSEIEWD